MLYLKCLRRTEIEKKIKTLPEHSQNTINEVINNRLDNRWSNEATSIVANTLNCTSIEANIIQVIYIAFKI